MDILVPAGGDRPRTVDSLRSAITTGPASLQVKRILHVLIDDVENAKNGGESLLTQTYRSVHRVGDEIVQLHQNVEVWFNDSMERVAGWYKRRTQMLTLVIAATLVVLLNVDTVEILHKVSSDSALRAVLVAQAEKLAAQPPAANPAPAATPSPVAATREAAADFQKQIAALQQTGLPLGWRADALPQRPGDWLTKILGLLLSIGAASLGAPFWFDILNKVVTIRSAGKAPEEVQKRPKEVPKPAAPGQPAS